MLSHAKIKMQHRIDISLFLQKQWGQLKKYTLLVLAKR